MFTHLFMLGFSVSESIIIIVGIDINIAAANKKLWLIVIPPTIPEIICSGISG